MTQLKAKCIDSSVINGGLIHVVFAAQESGQSKPYASLIIVGDNNEYEKGKEYTITIE